MLRMEEDLFSKKMKDSDDLLRFSMNKKFFIEMCGDVALEGMAIYINCGTEKIASITYENGIHNMEIEFFPFGKGKDPRVFALKEFLVFLEKAENLAIKCAKEDELHC